MSVIKFTPEEFATLAKSLKADHKIRTAILYTSQFKRESLHNWQKLDEKGLVDHVISYLVGHLWKANLFCWLAMYPKDWKTAEELNKDFPEGRVLGDRKKLLRELSSLNYNLATNDGNRFVDPDWYETFKLVMDSLKDELLNEVLYPNYPE